MYEFTGEETFERWVQNEYQVAVELGYSRKDCAKILQMDNRNDILRYMKELRKGGNKTNKKPLSISDIKVKDPDTKDFTTCFYWSDPRNACMCLNRCYCKDGTECSFWLNKETTRWGETIYQGHKVKHPITIGR